MRVMHGCDPAGGMVVDLTGEPAPTILVGLDFSFRPSCARVRVGQRVTFRGDGGNDWRAHPLRAGVIEAGAVADDPASPIPDTNRGEEDITVVFPAPGTYGYYCTRHWSLGFFGTVHAVP
jgi:plastocyanin